MPFTLRNLKEDLDDFGVRFDGGPDLEFRSASVALELEKSGLNVALSGRARLSKIVTSYRAPGDAPHFCDSFDRRGGGVVKAILRPN